MSANGDGEGLLAVVGRASTRDLLRLYSEILSELERREVVRSRNAPAGDYAEYLAALVYRGVLAPRSAKSWDVRAEDGRTVQVKCRVLSGTARSGGNYSFFRSWDFDVCVFVLLDASYDVVAAVEVPSEGARSLARFTAHVNGSRVRVREDLLGFRGRGPHRRVPASCGAVKGSGRKDD